MKTAYLMIRAKHGKTRLVLDRLLKFEQIVEIHELFGRYDIVCKIEVDSDSKLKLFIQNKLWITEDIDRCETFIVADTHDEPDDDFSANDNSTSVAISDDEEGEDDLDSVQ